MILFQEKEQKQKQRTENLQKLVDHQGSIISRLQQKLAVSFSPSSPQLLSYPSLPLICFQIAEADSNRRPDDPAEHQKKVGKISKIALH